MVCKDLLNSSKCDLVIDSIHVKFGDFMPKVPKQVPMLHQNIEITARCIECDRKYYFTLNDLKIEDFGQIWRTAVFSKQYKPEG